jgi:hypothetical protein
MLRMDLMARGSKRNGVVLSIASVYVLLRDMYMVTRVDTATIARARYGLTG